MSELVKMASISGPALLKAPCKSETRVASASWFNRKILWMELLCVQKYGDLFAPVLKLKLKLPSSEILHDTSH